MILDQFLDQYYKENEALRLVLLCHSRQVADKACEIGERFGIDTNFLYEAQMLHDIRIVKDNSPSIHCYGTEPYIRHGILGAEMLSDERFARICARHTGSGLTREEIIAQNLPLPHIDLLPETIEEKLICYADSFFSKTQLGVEKPLDRVIKSMEKHGPATLERFLALHELFIIH